MRVFAIYLDHPVDSLTEVETEQASIFLWTLIRNAENVFYQYREGVIGLDALGTYGFVGAYFQRPNFSEHWARIRGWFDSEFVAAFEAANGLQIP
jgi:hypothetical protein